MNNKEIGDWGLGLLIYLIVVVIIFYLQLDSLFCLRIEVLLVL